MGRFSFGRDRRRVYLIVALLALLAGGSVLKAGWGAAKQSSTPRDSTATAATTATLLATGTVGGDATATLTSVADTPVVSPTVAATATVPDPPPLAPSKLKTVHRTNGYQIGSYYFSGWSHGQNDNLTPTLIKGPLSAYQPLIGWYDDTQDQVDRHIVQASAAGINFFAFDWYDTAKSPYATDQTLNQGLDLYLTSKQRYRMNFCLTFIDQAPFLPKPKDWPGLVDNWISYFKQPDYVRVNGKPLFIVFSPEHMRTDVFGSSAKVRQALDYLRKRAVQAHLPGVTIAVGTTLVPHYNPGRIGQLLSEGYDVTTGYNYHAMGNEQYRKPVPYSNLVQENQQMWDRVARNINLPYIPVITSGWDQRFSYREQSTAIIYAGRTAKEFGCYAASARSWIDANAKRTVKERVVMVFAWNEIGEGGAIIPTKAYGYSFTDALRKAFSSAKPSC
jgi:hypothetical protein